MVGGIFLTLYGIHISGTNLQKILGSHLEEILKKAKGNSFKGLVIGAATTGAIHSSSTTAIMLIGLITGSFMGLVDTIPIILGASIGSTIVTQIASIRIGGLALLIMSAGVFTHLSARNKINMQAGEAMTGFGFIFLGAQLMFSAVAAMSSSAAFLQVMNVFAELPGLALLCGTFLTVISGSTAIASILAVALGMSGVADLSTALFMILGINLGSSFKDALLTLRRKNFSGKLALIHIVSNLIGVLSFLILFGFFRRLVEFTSADPARQIANAHTLYNVISALIFIPFIPSAIRLVQKNFPDSPMIEKEELSYLDRKLVCTPSVSLAQVNNGTVEMARVSCEMLELSRAMFFEEKPDLFENICRCEDRIDGMTERISEYIIRISQQNLGRDDAMKLYSLMRIVADIERLCDHIVFVADIFASIQKDKTVFSEKAKNEIAAIYGKLRIMQNLIIKSMSESNVKLANEINGHENKVDEIIKKISANSQKRLEDGACSQEADRYFSNILCHLERVGDHYDNIAYAIIDGSSGKKKA